MVTGRGRRWGLVAAAAVLLGLVVVGFYRVQLGRARAAVARFGPDLAAPDPQVRVAAAVALSERAGGWGSGAIAAERPRILDVLLEGLGAADVAVCSRAAEALARWGPQAAEVLQRGLGSPHQRVRIHAAWALSITPLPDLIPALRSALQDGRVEVRVYALEALGAMALNRVDEELIGDVVFRVWKDTEALARNAAAETLYRLGHATGIPLLVRSLEGRFWERFNAYERLVRIYAAEDRTLPPFYADGHAARRAEEAARIRAVVFEDAALQRRLIADLAVYKSQLFTATKWALEEFGPRVVPALCEALDHADRSVRVHSAEVLAGMADLSTPATFRLEARPALLAVARPALRQRLAAPHPEVSVAMYAMQALGNLRVAADIDVLLGHARGADPDLAVSAIENIGRIGGPEARQALEALTVSGELERERQRALAALDAAVR
ncbi:MAG: HEAT repeat domain-containing protein [Planctomycetes bacterium]|nr:HEAT repeat domain-containing protein [Planctomycetota bacterium]